MGFLARKKNGIQSATGSLFSHLADILYRGILVCFLLTSAYILGWTHVNPTDFYNISLCIYEIFLRCFVGSPLQAWALLFALLCAGHWLRKFRVRDRTTASEILILIASSTIMFFSYYLHDEVIYGKWDDFANWWKGDNFLHTTLLLSSGMMLGYFTHWLLYCLDNLFPKRHAPSPKNENDGEKPAEKPAEKDAEEPPEDEKAE